MQGELDFQQSFRARVALLKGLDAAVLPKIAAKYWNPPDKIAVL
jgi:phosphoserine phosphatase